ncbi:MAG: hypothetical protein ACPIOQ_55855 [Promethearchaeia archaeon]
MSAWSSFGAQLATRSTVLRPATCSTPSLRAAKVSLRMSEESLEVCLMLLLARLVCMWLHGSSAIVQGLPVTGVAGNRSAQRRPRR